MACGRAWMLVALLAACASSCDPQRTTSAAATARGPAASVASFRAGATSIRLRVLTYNVAGLPQWLSRSRPREYLPRIGELMSRYDLVLVQEDFAYPQALRERTRFRQQTPSHAGTSLFNLGDGLSRFAAHPFTALERVPWSTCHGHLRRGCDCMAPKGFSVATHEVAPGVSLDVYNFHLDAGKAHGDTEARKAQTAQLVRYVRHHSRGRALLLAGDTNFRTDEDRRDAETRLRELGLQDACEALQCPAPHRIDRVFFRSSRQVKITPKKWRIDSRFVTDSGQGLSDHKAIAVTLDVRTRR